MQISAIDPSHGYTVSMRNHDARDPSHGYTVSMRNRDVIDPSWAYTVSMRNTAAAPATLPAADPSRNYSVSMRNHDHGYTTSMRNHDHGYTTSMRNHNPARVSYDPVSQAYTVALSGSTEMDIAGAQRHMAAQQYSHVAIHAEFELLNWLDGEDLA